MFKLDLKINSNPLVADRWKTYPADVQEKLNALRELVIEVASESEVISEIEETLKWNEVSYLVKKGSTIRIDWKEKTPDQYAMYFKCTSKLVESFRHVYGNLFNYEKNRAIVFSMDDALPNQEIKNCINAALNYHRLKNQEYLGLAST